MIYEVIENGWRVLFLGTEDECVMLSQALKDECVDVRVN